MASEHRLRRCSGCEKPKERWELLKGRCDLCSKQHRKTRRKAATPQQQAKAKETGKRWRELHANSLKEYARNRHQEKKYGLTPEGWALLFDKQGRKCACCGADRPTRTGGKGWHTDHDHRTGAVRGITCLKCNSLLGYLGDGAADVAANAKMLLDYLARSGDTP